MFANVNDDKYGRNELSVLIPIIFSNQIVLSAY